MSLTRVADVLDKLYDEALVNATLAALVAAGDLVISDGPPIIDWSGKSLLIYGGTDSQEEDGVTNVAWQWNTSGTSGSTAEIAETIQVPCAIVTLRGDADMRAARRRAMDIYAAAAEQIRGSTLGIDVVMWETCAVSSIRQSQTADGAEVAINFVAHVRTQI